MNSLFFLKGTDMEILLVLLIFLGIFTLAYWVTSFAIDLANTFKTVSHIHERLRRNDNRNR